MEQQDFLNEMEENKLPSTLNVLTILTFIWSGISALFEIYNFATADSGVKKMEDAMKDPNMQKAPEFLKNMMSPEMLEMKKTMAANKLPILILGILGVILCIMGAIQMRKRQKQGYFFWLIGELLPIVGMAIFIGISVFKGFALIGLLFPLVFIILYTVQKKHLTK